jgi:hypothetical protein
MGISSAPVVQRAAVDAALDVASAVLIGERGAKRPERGALPLQSRDLAHLLISSPRAVVAGGEPVSQSIGGYG